MNLAKYFPKWLVKLIKIVFHMDIVLLADYYFDGKHSEWNIINQSLKFHFRLFSYGTRFPIRWDPSTKEMISVDKVFWWHFSNLMVLSLLGTGSTIYLLLRELLSPVYLLDLPTRLSLVYLSVFGVVTAGLHQTIHRYGRDYIEGLRAGHRLQKISVKNEFLHAEEKKPHRIWEIPITGGVYVGAPLIFGFLHPCVVLVGFYYRMDPFIHLTPSIQHARGWYYAGLLLVRLFQIILAFICSYESSRLISLTQIWGFALLRITIRNLEAYKILRNAKFMPLCKLFRLLNYAFTMLLFGNIIAVYEANAAMLFTFGSFFVTTFCTWALISLFDKLPLIFSLGFFFFILFAVFLIASFYPKLACFYSEVGKTNRNFVFASNRILTKERKIFLKRIKSFKKGNGTTAGLGTYVFYTFTESTTASFYKCIIDNIFSLVLSSPHS